MYTFCGDHYPPALPERTVDTSSLSHVDSSSTATCLCHVRLSWARITKNVSSLEVIVERSDVHYLLYQKCLKYLIMTYPISSLKCSTPSDIMDQLGQLPPSFGILVNLLADKYPRPDLKNLPPEGLAITFRSTSVLDFILSGMLAAVVTLKYHINCALRESPNNDTTEADIYEALFLDCITSLWEYECHTRSGTAEWSPMPWSRESLQEISATTSAQGPLTYHTPTLSEDDLVEEDNPGIPTARSIYGSPMDIPWFGASHDGYPFCNTLSSYTIARRSSVIQTLQDDAALWVSAMTFGVLEIVTRTRIPESMFLVSGADPGETVLSGDRILRFLLYWYHHMCRWHHHHHHHLHHHHHHHDHGQNSDHDHEHDHDHDLVHGHGHDHDHDHDHDHEHDHHHHHHHHHHDEAHLQHGLEVARVLDRALNALDEEEWENASIFVRAGHPTTEVTHMVCTVALTIAPLCELASNIWDTLHEMDHLMDRAQDKLRNLYNATLSSCEDRMCRAGWCRNTVSHDFMSTLWGLRIVSNLVRLPPYIRKSPDEHKSCDESHCVFYKIDTTTYVPRHVEPSCACAYIKPSFEDVVHLLEEGFVPVVVYDGTQLRVQPASAGPYVAISHVWADGMGSTTVDGVPGCVVKRIASLARRLLPESGAFWMDSLCIPDTGNLRTKAIKLMAQTYRDAASVLVLDDCIRAQCSEDKSWEENLFRIAASGWVRRVWTLQEGLLARELYFEFADGPVNVEERLKLLMAQSTDEDRPDSFEYLNPRSCSSHVSVLDYRLRHGPNQTSHNVPLDSVIRLLRLRSTTKPEDELIAIHSLIPFNVDALLKIKGKDAAQRRIRAFLLEQGTVSKELPTQLTPRMSLAEPGFSWAPRTLVSAIEGAGLDSGTGKCTPDGLVAEYNIAAFDEPVQIPAEYMTDPKHRFLRILITLRGTRATYMLRLYVALGNQGATSFDGLAFCDADVDSAGSGLQGPKSRCFAVSGARELRRPLTRKGPLNYVAPGRILRMALQSDRFRPEDLSVMGNLEKYLVQLV